MSNILSVADIQMLIHQLEQLSTMYSYQSCNDPTYPENWTEGEIAEYDALIKAADPDKSKEYDPEEDVCVFDGTIVQYLIDKLDKVEHT